MPQPPPRATRLPSAQRYCRCGSRLRLLAGQPVASASIVSPAHQQRPAGAGSGFAARPERRWAAGAASTAQTVIPESSDLTPHCLDRYSTMASPRPPSDERVGWAVVGLVGAPPSLTATSTASASSAHATCTLSPGSGRACRMALLSSSLTTRTASPTAASKMPAAVRSAASRRRTTPTLAGAQGRSTVPAALTPQPRKVHSQPWVRPDPDTEPCGGDARPRLGGNRRPS